MYFKHTLVHLLQVLICTVYFVMCSLVCVPAGVSLATASVDALGQSVVQTGINHIQTDWLLMHLTARVPVQHKHTIIKHPR